MKRAARIVGLALIAATIAIPCPCPAEASDDNCVTCHSELGGELAAPTTEVPESAHGDVQLSCAACHGGDPGAEDMDESMSPDKGFVGAPTVQEIPSFCGKCHSDEAYMRQYRPRIPVDQEKAYYTSMHGQLLQQGDDKVAQCVSCHGSHSVKMPRNPQSKVYPTNVPSTCGKCHSDPDYMADYGIPVDQLSQYEQSVHGHALLDQGDLGAPACNDCHSNHGAVPPGVTSVANICGNCHPSARELFVASPHKEAFDAMGLSECIECHGNHLVKKPTDEMLGAGKDAVCANCHAEGETGLKTAREMKRDIVSLDESLQEVTAMVARAAGAGMEMSDQEFTLREARNRLVMARNLVHTLQPDTVAAVAEDGGEKVAQARVAAQDAFHELGVRRRGLALSSIVIVVLIAGLYLTLRKVERRQGRRE